MSKPPVGEQELKVLRHISERGALTVGEVAEAFAQTEGWARSTVLTVMERLRKKRYLSRRREAGVFRYQSPVDTSQLLHGVVENFVTTTLGGSLSPFVAFLARSEQLKPDEVTQLEQLAARLAAKSEESEGDDE